MLTSNAELSRKLVVLEKNYDVKFKAIFEAIHQLMAPADPKKETPHRLCTVGKEVILTCFASMYKGT